MHSGSAVSVVNNLYRQLRFDASALLIDVSPAHTRTLTCDDVDADAGNVHTAYGHDNKADARQRQRRRRRREGFIALHNVDDTHTGVWLINRAVADGTADTASSAAAAAANLKAAHRRRGSVGSGALKPKASMAAQEAARSEVPHARLLLAPLQGGAACLSPVHLSDSLRGVGGVLALLPVSDHRSRKSTSRTTESMHFTKHYNYFLLDATSDCVLTIVPERTAFMSASYSHVSFDFATSFPFSRCRPVLF
jgi:hypothetical protein